MTRHHSVLLVERRYRHLTIEHVLGTYGCIVWGAARSYLVREPPRPNIPVEPWTKTLAFIYLEQEVVAADNCPAQLLRNDAYAANLCIYFRDEKLTSTCNLLFLRPDSCTLDLISDDD